MSYKAGAANHGAVNKGGTNTQVFDNRHDPHGGSYAGGGNAINILHGQACIINGTLGCLDQDFHFGVTGCHTQTCLPYTDNSGSTP